MKKGFTLVELLAVITVMGIVLLISVPNITKYGKKTVSNQYLQFTEDLFLATESYLTTNIDKINFIDNKTTINVDRLIKSGYFKSTTINPKSNEKINMNSYIIVDNSGDEYSYKFVDKSVEICEVSDETTHRYSCDPGDGEYRFFYRIAETEEMMILIMDRNIGENVSFENAKTYLKKLTSNWVNTEVILLSDDDYNSCDSSCRENVDNENDSYWLNSGGFITRGGLSNSDGSVHGIRPVIIVRK